VQIIWHSLNQTTLIGLLLLVVALIGSRTAWFAHASLRWPTTPARIDYLGLSRLKREGEYALIARYSYTVNGITYESTRWRFGASPSGNMAAITLASTQIKPVGPVVFYDPDKPSRSCLVAGLDESALVIPIILLVVGLTVLVDGIWRLGL
jgi:hypothetical protein